MKNLVLIILCSLFGCVCVALIIKSCNDKSNDKETNLHLNKYVRYRCEFAGKEKEIWREKLYMGAILVEYDYHRDEIEKTDLMGAIKDTTIQLRSNTTEVRFLVGFRFDRDEKGMDGTYKSRLAKWSSNGDTLYITLKNDNYDEGCGLFFNSRLSDLPEFISVRGNGIPIQNMRN